MNEKEEEEEGKFNKEYLKVHLIVQQFF